MNRGLNVERMRRYARRGRPLPSPLEKWERFIGELGLSVVSCRWPFGPGDTVPLDDHDAEQLRWEQARLGVTVDGILGVQTWMALAEHNDAMRAI